MIKKTKRSCLGCCESFDSQGRFNRICGECKRKNRYDFFDAPQDVIWKLKQLPTRIK